MVGSGLCAAIITLRLFGGSKLSFQGVSVPIEYSWLPLVILTFAHGYASLLLLKSARGLHDACSETECKEVWHQIVGQGGMFMRGMKPRLLPLSGGLAPMGNEPSTWVTHICAIMLFVAAVPYEAYLSWKTLFAFALVFVNWRIGSIWAIALSELATPKDQSLLLARRVRSNG
jgi:hypothetical protein